MNPSPEIIIKENIILISVNGEFATLFRRPNAEGLHGATFSIPLTAKIADYLENSGIVEVESFNENGILSFRRKAFYETHLMCNIIVDILLKNQQSEI